MSSIPVKDSTGATRALDVFSRVDGPTTVETQAVAIVDPDTGLPARPDASGRLVVVVADLSGTIKQTDTPFTNGDSGVLLLAKRRDSDTTSVSADGDYTTLNMDEFGRLKVAAQPAGYARTEGDISAINGVVALNVARVSNLMVQMVVPTAVAGINCAFEGSLNSTNGTDGNWIGLQAIRSNANTIETTTGALAAAPAYGWELSVNGLNWVRVRCTAITSGLARFILQPAPYATEPIPGAQVSATQPVSLAAGTARAGFLAAAGIWYDDSSAALAANATVTGASRDLTVGATATAFASAAAYPQELRGSAEADVAGTLWLEVSRDNTNWRRIKSVPTAAVAGGGHYAEIIHRPSWRYARFGFTNGAAAQARFALGSILMAA